MQRTHGIKRDANKAFGEKADFPSVCEKCLPESAFVMMMKEDMGAECKMCTRPFTVFSWRKGRARGNKQSTVICNTCSTQNNCCQACMLDLQYGLPLNIRDAALKMASTGPTSAINREYHAQNNDGNIAGIDKEQQSKTARELLSRLAKSSGAFNRAADPKIAKGDMNTTGGDSSSRRIEAPPARNDFVNRKKGERTERGLPYARKEASGTMASGYSPRPGPPIDRGETPTKKTKTAAAAASGGESVTASGSDVAPAPSEPGDTPT